MAIQIFRQPGPTWAESINTGLSGLAQKYNQDIQKQQQQTKLQEAFSVLSNPQASAVDRGRALSLLPAEYIKALGKSGFQASSQTPLFGGVEANEFAIPEEQMQGSMPQSLEQSQSPLLSSQGLSELMKGIQVPSQYGIPDQTLDIMKKLQGMPIQPRPQEQIQEQRQAQTQQPQQQAEQQMQPKQATEAQRLYLKAPAVNASMTDAQLKQYVNRYKKFNESIDKTIEPFRNVLIKAHKLADLFETGNVPSGVASGALAGNKFLRGLINTEGQQFDTLGDDIASDLTSLQTGVQTISKIRYNKDRKAALWQDPKTQASRIENALEDAERGLLVTDIRDYLVERRADDLDINLRKIYDKLYTKIPSTPPDAADGQRFYDKNTNTWWEKDGLRMKFVGIGEPRRR